MKAYYNQNKILLDFEKPILYNPLITFSINSQEGFTAVPGPNTDTLEIAVPSDFGPLDDLHISYTAIISQPFLYLSGPANTRLIPSFEIPVFITAQDPAILNVSNAALNPLITDFIDAYGLTEAILITNPENSTAQSPDEYKLLRALEDAEALYNSYVGIEVDNPIVTAGRRRTILTFARYFLDSRCRRKVVTDDYNNVIKELESFLNSAESTPIADLYDGADLAYSGIEHCPIDNCGCNYYC